MADPTWAQYREEAFGEPYLVWHDGPDFAVFQDRWAADPALAARMLLAGVAEGDALAARTIRELELTPDQRSHFTATLLAASVLHTGASRIAAARSLYELTGDAGSASAIAEELNAPRFWSDQLDAALALRDFPPTADLVTSLSRAIRENEEYLVRYHASNTLLRWSGSDHEIEDEAPLFGLLVGEDPAGWGRVADDLTARVALDEGDASRVAP